LDPAVGSASGRCPDENDCGFEKLVLCAFQQCGISGQVQFLACMDEHRSGTALADGEICASTAGLSFSPIQICYEGNQGVELLTKAAQIYAGANVNSVPHIFVDGTYCAASYASLKSRICQAGSTAAVCGGPTPAPTPAPTPSGGHYYCRFDYPATYSCQVESFGTLSQQSCEGICHAPNPTPAPSSSKYYCRFDWPSTYTCQLKPYGTLSYGQCEQTCRAKQSSSLRVVGNNSSPSSLHREAANSSFSA